jgi:hypothetical protein
MRDFVKSNLMTTIFLINIFSIQSLADAYQYKPGDISVRCSTGSHLVEDVYHAGHFLKQDSDTIGVTHFENHYDKKTGKYLGDIDHSNQFQNSEAKPGGWQMMIDENATEVQLNMFAGIAAGAFLVREKLSGTISYSLDGSAKNSCDLKVYGQPEALYINSSPDIDEGPISSPKPEVHGNSK